MLRRVTLIAVMLLATAAAQDEPDGEPEPDTPFKLDNTACPTFLTGIWLANSQQDVAPGPDQALWHVTAALVLNPDGKVEQAFAAGVAGDEPEETKTFGTWLAGPGSAKDRCTLAIVFEEGEQRTAEVTATTGTRILIDGQAFPRAR